MMQQVTPKITEIKKMPTLWDNPQKIHESIFRAHGTLMLIIDMVNRGDSKESVWNVYDEIYNSDIHKPKITFKDSGNTSSLTYVEPEDKN